MCTTRDGPHWCPSDFTVRNKNVPAPNLETITCSSRPVVSRLANHLYFPEASSSRNNFTTEEPLPKVANQPDSSKSSGNTPSASDGRISSTYSIVCLRC